MLNKKSKSIIQCISRQPLQSRTGAWCCHGEAEPWKQQQNVSECAKAAIFGHDYGATIKVMQGR